MKNSTTNKKKIDMKIVSKRSPTLFAIWVANDVFSVIGAILLLIGIYQEYQFRTSADFSDVSQAGIKWLRSLSPYSNSITYLVIGICILAISLTVSIYLSMYIRSNGLSEPESGNSDKQDNANKK